MQSARTFDYNQFSDSTFQTCLLGKVFTLSKERRGGETAEGGSSEPMFISDYRKAHIDLDVTKKVAEREREKGASWEICEVESIIFRFDQIDYVVYDWDMIFDIRDLRNEIEAVRSISTLHEWVASHVEGAPFVVVGNMLLKPAALPFRRYNSRAKGGGYYLSWHASARNRDLSDTIATMSGVIVDYQKMCFRKHHAA